MKKRIIIVLCISFLLCMCFVGFNLLENPQSETLDNTLPQNEEYTLYTDKNEDFVPPCIVLPSTVTRLSDNTVISLDTPDMAVSKELSDFFCSREYTDPFCKCMPEYYFENGYGSFSFSLSGRYARNDTGQYKLTDEQINRIKTLIEQ